MGNPAIGRIVHYRFLDSEGGMERPAIIVRLWGEEAPESAVQLQVFIDANEQGEFNDGSGGSGIGVQASSNVIWRTSVLQGSAPGQYHFHEDCRAAGVPS